MNDISFQRKKKPQTSVSEAESWRARRPEKAPGLASSLDSIVIALVMSTRPGYFSEKKDSCSATF
jgi:hypothetical protein